MLPFDSSLQLFGDRQRLKQVMINLITNAIKYTEYGKIEIGLIEEKNMEEFLSGILESELLLMI